MRRADRLFKIIQTLRSRRITTARYLAEELEVSERTIYRDIRDLTLSQVPIEGEAGLGYTLRNGYDLPPLMFDEEECQALVLGARIVQSWADPALARAAGHLLRKVETVLPAGMKESLLKTGLYSPFVQIPGAVAATMSLLRQGIDEKRKVRFSYRREDGQLSRRTVRPLGLFFWGKVWTLGAWCEMREFFRNFRLDRMENCQLLKTAFTEESGKTLEDYHCYEKENCGEEFPPETSLGSDRSWK